MSRRIDLDPEYVISPVHSWNPETCWRILRVACSGKPLEEVKDLDGTIMRFPCPRTAIDYLRVHSMLTLDAGLRAA